MSLPLSAGILLKPRLVFFALPSLIKLWGQSSSVMAGRSAVHHLSQNSLPKFGLPL
jgi:hypothetical protein